MNREPVFFRTDFEHPESALKHVSPTPRTAHLLFLLSFSIWDHPIQLYTDKNRGPRSTYGGGGIGLLSLFTFTFTFTSLPEEGQQGGSRRARFKKHAPLPRSTSVVCAPSTPSPRLRLRKAVGVPASRSTPNKKKIKKRGGGNRFTFLFTFTFTFASLPEEGRNKEEAGAHASKNTFFCRAGPVSCARRHLRLRGYVCGGCVRKVRARVLRGG